MSIKSQVWQLVNYFDRKLKFPYLNEGGIGIQIGFDMQYPITSDLFSMAKAVGPTGKILGIEPDPEVIEKAQKIIRKRNYPISIIPKATFHRQESSELSIGRNKSWSQLSNLPTEHSSDFLEQTIPIQSDTLDNIIDANDMDIHSVRHINITNNGAEYHTLLGMQKMLGEAKNISITATAGRYDPTGVIAGKQDHFRIRELLEEYNFTTRFYRIHQLFWWGFVHKLLLNRKWVYGNKNYGVVMAFKGNQKIPLYQSFS